MLPFVLELVMQFNRPMLPIREEVEPANLSGGIANAVQVQMRPGSPSTSQSKGLRAFSCSTSWVISFSRQSVRWTS